MRYFAVKTDHHIVEPGMQLEGVDTAARAKAVVESISAEPVGLECIVDLGDVGDTALNPKRAEAEGSPEAYKHAAEILSPINERTLYLPGNHDSPSLLLEALGSHWDSSSHGCSVHQIPGVTLIGIDLRAGPVATGELREETAVELSKALELAGKCIILSHYPWRPSDSPWIEAHARVTNGDRVAAILSPHRHKILGAFHGHLHSWWSGCFAGISFYGCGGSAGGFVFEPEHATNSRNPAAPFGYLLVGYDEHDSMLVRPRFI